MEDALIQEKKTLRKTYIDARESIPSNEAEAADAAIASVVLGAGFYEDAKSIFVFISVEGEVDTTPVIHKAFEDGKSVLVPRTAEGRTMEAVYVDAEEYLAKARTEWPRCFNIPEPPAALPAANISDIDLVIVPSLALDPWGYRLGYGGGYYDHFIKAARETKKRPVFAAVQRACFVRDEALPREPYDEPVDIIVTENGIVIPSSCARAY